MTNVGKATKEKLHSAVDCSFPTVKRKLVSQLDGTVKYLFSLSDGNCIESVVMKYEHGYTICVSSQVGCRMGCKFCASTIAGRVRDLEAGEILGQIISAQRDMNIRISNIVMMGIGEPLDNYDNVVSFLNLVNLPDGVNIGYRHISLSTCGIVPKIYSLAELNLPITLSVSLHATSDAIRSEIMPVNKAYGVDELLDACRDYYRSTERRISFEYTLISGKNDTKENALHLANTLNAKLRSRTETMPIHVNLIPVNEVTESGFKSSDKGAVKRFAATLESRGIRATIRRTLGSDINASCGQLRREDAGEA
jgi:23S rRNA (adenine2503-C2)-methyltransferase